MSLPKETYQRTGEGVLTQLTLEQMLIERLGIESLKDLSGFGSTVGRSAIVIDAIATPASKTRLNKRISRTTIDLDFTQLSLMDRKSILAYRIWVESNSQYGQITYYLGEDRPGAWSMLEHVLKEELLTEAYTAVELLEQLIKDIWTGRDPLRIKRIIDTILALREDGLMDSEIRKRREEIMRSSLIKNHDQINPK